MTKHRQRGYAADRLLLELGGPGIDQIALQVPTIRTEGFTLEQHTTDCPVGNRLEVAVAPGTVAA